MPFRPAERYLATGRHPPRWAGESPPFPIADLFCQQHFDLALALTLAEAKKTCRNDTAVVQHEHVARLQQCRKLVKLRVLPCSALAIQEKHATCAAFSRGLLRN